MGIFDIGGGSGRQYWNFSDQNKEEFSTTITGDVVEIIAVPRYGFGTQTIERWPDGNPKVNMLLVIQRADGQERCVNIKFNSSAKEDRWPRIQQALFNALRSCGLPGASMKELGGLNITIATQAPPQGFGYSAQNPRPYTCQVNGRGTAPFRGCIDEVSKLREDGKVIDGMMAEQVASKPVNPSVTAAQQQAAQAMGFGNPAEQLYDHDIPF